VSSMWELGKTMRLPAHRLRHILIRQSFFLIPTFALLLLVACTHPSEPADHVQLEPHCVLVVSECAIRGNNEKDFLEVELINTGDIAFSVPTKGTNHELFVDPIDIQVHRWSDGRFCIVSNYWELPSFGGGEVGVMRLLPGEMIAGTVKLKQGVQTHLKEGRYLGVLRYDLGTWAAILAIPEIDRLHLTTHFLFDIPPPDARLREDAKAPSRVGLTDDAVAK